MRHFPRPDLARQLADAMRGEGLFSDAHNGLFLAAPRRTGKSTFLQQDLKPVLEARGVVVVYVDLWSDMHQDPADLIAKAIAGEIRQHLGVIAKATQAAGIGSVELPGGIRIDTSRIGKTDGLTLAAALQELQRMAAKPVALIIDEAQHALVSEQGEAAMMALKSARDQMNSPDQARLMLVMSGSDRDKLLRLVNTNGAPFYGSRIERLPELAGDFVRFVVEQVESQRPELKPVDANMLASAFQLFNHRPQFFISALGDALNPLADPDQRFEQSVLTAAHQARINDETQMAAEFLALNPVERAVFWRLLEKGPQFRPYDAEALRFYNEKAGKKVSAASAQSALDALRSRTPALIWKSARGEYSVNDAMMHRWYEKQRAAGHWPPTIASLSRKPDDVEE